MPCSIARSPWCALVLAACAGAAEPAHSPDPGYVEIAHSYRRDRVNPGTYFELADTAGREGNAGANVVLVVCQFALCQSKPISQKSLLIIRGVTEALQTGDPRKVSAAIDQIPNHEAYLRDWLQTLLTAFDPNAAIASGILENKAAGDAFRDEVAAEIEKTGKKVRREVRVDTPFGARYLDIEVTEPATGELSAVEAKSHNARYRPSQRAKDEYLKRVLKLVTTVIRRGK